MLTTRGPNSVQADKLTVFVTKALCLRIEESMLILGFMLGSHVRNREWDLILMGSFQLEICDSDLWFCNSGKLFGNC